jgi:PAS domain S-box-containing protein
VKLDFHSDINREYAHAMNYGDVDRFIVKILWWHLAATVMLGVANSVFQLAAFYPSPFAWRVISPTEAAGALGVGLAAALLPTIGRRVLTNHYAWRVLVSGALTTYSYLFVFLSGGSIEMHFHFFMVLALLVVYYDWRLGWIVLGLTALHHGVLNYIAPHWVYFYGRNDLAVVAHALPVTATALFTSLLCRNNRRALVVMEDTRQALERDIAARERAQAALAQAREEALAASRENARLYEEAARGRRELAEQSMLLQTTLENIGQGIAVFDQDLRFLGGNTRAFDLLGFPLEFFVVGKPLAEFFGYNAERGEYGPGDAAEQVAERVALARRFEPHCFERTRPDGTVLEVRGNPMPDGGFVTTYTDITARKQAEEELRESEERFRSSFEHSGVAMALQQLDGEYFRVNHAFCDLLGYSERELLATHFQRVTHPEECGIDVAHDRAMLAGERSWYQREKRYLHKSGRIIWVLASVSLVRDSRGRPLYFIVQAQDVTARKQAEDSRAQLEAQLRQAQKMEAVGRLAGGVAHDFNNLLTVIRGRAELLLRRLAADDHQRRHLVLLEESAERAAALTQQLLAFSRKQVLQPKVLDLNTLLGGIEQMLRRLIGEDIDVVVKRAAALSPVEADPSQLEQVLMNLVVNARDAMPRGGRLTLETANIELDQASARSHPGARPGAYVMLAVSDNGIGMDAETQARLFEPFFTTKGPGKGTGLGLATVYGIVKQSGGSIWVYSEVGQGTTFKIYLPRVQGRAENAEPICVKVAPARSSETVLLVEDEEAVRHLAREVLQSHGYTVLEARHPGEALRFGSEHPGPIHLLLTDVVMPQMGGREVASRLAPRRPEMQVLFMSGYTDEAIVHQGVLDAGTAFLQKPFSVTGLVQKVREVLSGPRSRVFVGHGSIGLPAAPPATEVVGRAG